MLLSWKIAPVIIILKNLIPGENLINWEYFYEMGNDLYSPEMMLFTRPGIVPLLVIIIVTLTFSCEEKGILPDCDDCSENEPYEAYIEAKLDFNVNGVTRVQIFEGNLEDNVLYGSWDATNSTVFFRHMPLNRKYTLKAIYLSASDKTFIATDAITPRVRIEKFRCKDPCYIVYDRIANLKIRYTK